MREEQERWINIQANAAVADAMKVSSEPHEQNMASEIEEVEANFGEYSAEVLAFLRMTKLLIARDALIEAELLHREIVRRGGNI